MSFLELKDKTFLVVGIANRKSVAWSVAKLLQEEGAKILYCVRNKKRKTELQSLLSSDETIFTCDFEYESEIADLQKALSEKRNLKLDGLLHSIAFANYSEGLKPFHKTNRKDFLQATQISSFSLVELARICKPFLCHSASVVTVGISSTEVTAENYGYMAPIKASLEASVRYLAKSFSKDCRVASTLSMPAPLRLVHPLASPDTW